MKYKIIYPILALAMVVMVLSDGCKPQGEDIDPQFPTYSYIDPIVNPPDVFEILFNMSLNGNQNAYVTFKEDAVWIIEKLGESRISFAIANDTSNHIISSVDTIGLKGGYTYLFVANNNNYPDFFNFFTHYSKTSLDYNEFEPKF
ncbi:MAG: hypothetical protein QM503_02655 [Bacteroidota bacterium]